VVVTPRPVVRSAASASKGARQKKHPTTTQQQQQQRRSPSTRVERGGAAQTRAPSSPAVRPNPRRTHAAHAQAPPRANNFWDESSSGEEDDSAAAQLPSPLPMAAQRPALMAAFLRADANGNGVCTRAELIKALRTDEELRAALRLPARVREGATRTSFEAVFQSMDRDDDRAITAEEFVEFVLSGQGGQPAAPAQPEPEEELGPERLQIESESGGGSLSSAALEVSASSSSSSSSLAIPGASSSISEVARWLSAVGLGQHAASFREQRIDGQALLVLRRELQQAAWEVQAQIGQSLGLRIGGMLTLRGALNLTAAASTGETI
jgi:hypothetical protein